MDDQHLFDELLQAAERLGVEVRIEPFETPATMGGGLCVVRGETLVFARPARAGSGRAEPMAVRGKGSAGPKLGRRDIREPAVRTMVSRGSGSCLGTSAEGAKEGSATRLACLDVDYPHFATLTIEESP